MEIWIRDKEIIERMKEALKELDDEKKELYYNSSYPFMIEQESSITHKDVISFCQLLNISYKYIMLGNIPIYDVDDTNRIYETLIEKGDFTI